MHRLWRRDFVARVGSSHSGAMLASLLCVIIAGRDVGAMEPQHEVRPLPAIETVPEENRDGRPEVRFANRTTRRGPEELPLPRATDSAAIQQVALPGPDLDELEASARVTNPLLRQLRQEAAAAQARVRYVGKLPDPTIGTNVFGQPIETAAGAQRATLNVMQMLPWLERLDAQTQQAAFEAYAMRQQYLAEELRVLGDLRATWYRLYVLQKQLDVNRANQELLKSLTDLANARLQQNLGTVGDIALGSLEISRLEEQLVMLRQQIASTIAELNRLAARSPQSPIGIPDHLAVSLPDWNHEWLQQVAWQNQPEIAAAILQTRATRWGVEVARLKRRPDISLGATWYLIDDNRPTSAIVDIGQDAWALGAQVSIPLWHEKNIAMRDEATWKHFASHASVENLQQKYDALLVDLWEQARAADATAALYRDTILPQAEQTLAADQQALKDGAVEFDRVIQDVRNLLTLELGYHRAIGQLAAALARIQQAVGLDLALDPGDGIPPGPVSAP